MATFFFDIDGTLAYKGTIIEQNIETLAMLRKKGHLVCICSGRPITYIEALFAPYCDAIIANNGRYITYQGTCIAKEAIDTTMMWKYHRIAQEVGGMCNFSGISKRYTYAIKDSYKQRLYEHIQCDLVQLKQTDNVEVYSFEVNFLPPVSFAHMQAAFGEAVILNNHFDDFSADASISCFDKGDGIERLLDLLQLDKQETYAFGDGSNDVCMFRVCAHGIAMGNGVDALKKCAEYITNDFLNQGIQEALHYYKFI